MSANNDIQQTINSHIKEVTGHSNLAVTPRIYTYITDNPLTSILLGQIVYWSGIHKHADGYFWKSIPEWQEELGLKYNQVVVGIKKLEELGIITTCLRPIGHRLTTHYKLNQSRLIELIDLAAAEHYPAPIPTAPVSDIVNDLKILGTLEETDNVSDSDNSTESAKQPVADTGNTIAGEGYDLTREVVLTLNYPLNNTLTREVKESVCTLASLACASGQKSPAIATAPQPVAVGLFSPTMQVDLTFANQLQPTLLDLPPISESTRPPDANTEKITIRNKINPPKLPDFVSCNKPAKSKKTKAPPDPLLKAPAVMVYRHIVHAHMPVVARQLVVDAVKDSPNNLKLWEDIITTWVMRGYNPRNLDGMLKAFKAGGLGNNNNHNNKTTPADVHYAPSDPVEHIKSITPPDIWEKLGGDVRLAQAWQQVHYNPRWRETILKNDVEELKAVGVDRF